MKHCLCGNLALYLCKPHQVVCCKEHKALNEKGKQIDHIYEKFGQKLTAQRLAKIVEILSSKIKIADQCADQILEESKRILETIRDSCMRALVVVKEKRRRYADLLKICHKRIFDDKIEEFERSARMSLMVDIPKQFNEIQNLYKYDFLKEFETVNEISAMPVENAKLLLKDNTWSKSKCQKCADPKPEVLNCSHEYCAKCKPSHLTCEFCGTCAKVQQMPCTHNACEACLRIF